MGRSRISNKPPTGTDNSQYEKPPIGTGGRRDTYDSDINMGSTERLALIVIGIIIAATVLTQACGK